MNYHHWEKIRHWLILFSLLFLSVLVMLTQNTSLVSGFKSASLELMAALDEQINWVGGYYRAFEENSRLRDENMLLSSEVARSREYVALNDDLQRLLDLRESSGHTLQSARIVGRNPATNLLTLDVGTADSVKVGMAVIEPRGIIGMVIRVSASYALVLPFTNPDFRVTAKVQPSNTQGVIRWLGGYDTEVQLFMDHVVKTDDVLRGQRVVTSGYSEIFPPGLSIGTVDSVTVLTGRNELQVFVTPDVRLSQVEYVFVILQEADEERLVLETESQ